MEKKNRGGKDVSTCGHKLTRNTWPFFEARKIRTLARVSHMNVGWIASNTFHTPLLRDQCREVSARLEKGGWFYAVECRVGSRRIKIEQALLCQGQEPIPLHKASPNLIFKPCRKIVFELPPSLRGSRIKCTNGRIQNSLLEFSLKMKLYSSFSGKKFPEKS